MNSCTHEKWTAKEITLSDGRPSLREFCVTCGRSNGGSRLGFALPMIADENMTVPSFKYPGKTLGEIYQENPDYLKWLVLESKTSDRIKKSAARVYYHVPYTPPKDGEIYNFNRCYETSVGWECVERMKNQFSKISDNDSSEQSGQTRII